MIYHQDDGRQRFVQVAGMSPCVCVTAITFTAADIQTLLELKPEQLREWLGTGPACRFGPYVYSIDLEEQRRAVEVHNRSLDTSKENI
jgi:hypothetical protein